MSKKIPRPPKHVPGRVAYELLLEYFGNLAKSFPIGTIKEKSSILLDPVALLVNSDGAVEGIRVTATINLHFRVMAAPDAEDFLMEFKKVFEEDAFFKQYRLVETAMPLEPKHEAKGEASLSLRIRTARTKEMD